ncbi:hypothetical protein SAMN04487979_107131 [Flavobacterium sp. ov086]|nr:hypothetical protein SAMN04487979_107131 [Flavobacterium sp. ov086]
MNIKRKLRPKACPFQDSSCPFELFSDCTGIVTEIPLMKKLTDKELV